MTIALAIPTIVLVGIAIYAMLRGHGAARVVVPLTVFASLLCLWLVQTLLGADAIPVAIVLWVAVGFVAVVMGAYSGEYAPGGSGTSTDFFLSVVALLVLLVLALSHMDVLSWLARVRVGTALIGAGALALLALRSFHRSVQWPSER